MNGTKKLAEMTRDQACDIASVRFHKSCPGSQTGRRIQLQDGRRATVIESYCCVAGRYSGHVHLDGTPADELVVANWV
jgi:hypothetical protein